MIGLALILFIAVTTFWIVKDYQYWLKRRAINHNNRFWLRCFTLLPSVVFFWIGLPWFLLPLCGVMVGFGFMSIFDTVFNWLRGFKWNYPGSPGPEDGFIENLLQHWPWLQWVKIGLFVLLTVIYIWLISQN